METPVPFNRFLLLKISLWSLYLMNLAVMGQRLLLELLLPILCDFPNLQPSIPYLDGPLLPLRDIISIFLFLFFDLMH